MGEEAMTTSRRIVSRPLPLAVFVIFVWPGTVWAQSSLQAAQSLYAAAAYEEALALLDALQESAPSASDERLIQQSRALCLLALGRDADAERAIGAVVGADPAFRPDAASSSPRVREAFAEVRARVLPGVIAERYRTARRSFDGGDWQAAIAAFTEILALAGDPDLHGVASLPPVDDYRVLAEGFMTLAHAAITADERAAATVAPGQSVTTPTGGGDAVEASEPVDADRLYDASSADVAPPVTLVQELPAWPSSAFPPPSSGGLVEVTIDARGLVEGARITQPMSPLYDPLLLEAAREWLYEPARRSGEPVRFRKVIRVAFQ
jgi:hypothetical protein